MKRTLLTVIATFLLSAPLLGAIQTLVVPNKAFDVREANGIVDQGTIYPAALVIPFKDAAAQTAFYRDYADNNNWANASPQPTRRRFALDGLKQWMKEQSDFGRQKAQTPQPKPDISDLP